MMKNRSLLLKLLSAVIVFGAWEIAGRVPVSYAFPTFTDPDARRDLVRMLRGNLSGEWVSPNDPGVDWTPGD